MSPAYLAGETVDVTIRGAQVAYEPKDGYLTVVVGKRPAPHEALDWYVDLPLAAVDLVRSVPVDGEPRPGDLWTDAGGRLYLTYANRLRDGIRVDLLRADGNGSNQRWADVHAGSSGPISLHYRPDVDALGQRPIPAEAAPADVPEGAEVHATGAHERGRP